MKNLLAVVLLALAAPACGGGSDGPSLVGQWTFHPSDSSAAGYTFNDDSTYEAQLLVVTNTVSDASGKVISGSANDQIEKGTYTATGDTLTLDPRQSSCPGPDPSYQATYSFYQGGLRLVATDGIYILQRETGSLMGASFVVATGCFDSAGNFTASPLATVSN